MSTFFVRSQLIRPLLLLAMKTTLMRTHRSFHWAIILDNMFRYTRNSHQHIKQPGQFILIILQDSTDDFSAGNTQALTGLKYENLQIESVVSLAEGTDLVKSIDIDAEITQVNQVRTRNITSFSQSAKSFILLQCLSGFN